MKKTRVNDKNLDSLFARFFSESTLRQMLKTNHSKGLVKEFLSIIKNSDIIFSGNTYEDLFSFAYSHLSKNYRNEYIYKNAITKNILLGKHNLNTSFMLQEFRIGKCKADSVVLNGTSNVYEIKSELDSLDRLQNQVETYLKVFDMVHVITHPGQAQKISAVVPKCVGIMELNNKNNISTIREPKSGKKHIKTDLLFDSLRKAEYQSIVKSFYGDAPKVPNTKAYQVYKELFIKIPPTKAHDLAVLELKKRGNNLQLKKFISTAPDYFKSLSLHSRFTKKDAEAIKNLLTLEIGLAN